MGKHTLRQSPRVNHEALRPYTPFITSWSEEPRLPGTVVERPGVGIAYADEKLVDRDHRGVLWQRVASRPGHGDPLFAKVHSLRQRHAMSRLLCNVCAKPAHRDETGVLWVLKDERDDWPGWPERLATTEPPVCLPCAPLAARLCPALRPGAVAVRVRRAPLAGVLGVRYRSFGRRLEPVDDVMVAYGEAGARWVKAAKLVRELFDCTIVPWEELCRS